MYVGKNIRFKYVLQFSWKSLLVFLIYSSAVVYFIHYITPKFDGLPFEIVSVTGVAVAFYVGFKNNSSYERLWEARRIWGSYVNLSRTFTMYVLNFISSSTDMDRESILRIQKKIVKRHIGYINSVRIQLRKQTVWNLEEVGNKIVNTHTNFINADLDKELSQFMSDDEVDYVVTLNNPAAQIINLQSIDLKQLKEKKCIGDFDYVEISRTLAELYNQQGACERIKGFPFPRQYAYYSKVFVFILVGILPFSIYSELAVVDDKFVWLTIPISVVISWIFYTMEIVGDSSENPFENAINDVPMSAICKNIEIDLLQMIKETEIPEKVKAENNILL